MMGLTTSTKGISGLPDPDVIRKTANEIIQNPDYELKPVPDNSAAILELFARIMQWLLAPFLWLFGVLGGLSVFLKWVIVLAVACALIALIAYIGTTFINAVRGRKKSQRRLPIEERRPIDPTELESQAREAVLRGDFIGGVRLLFRACLLRLERSEKKKFRLGMTNREHLFRYRRSPFFGAMDCFVQTIDTKWYGDGRCLQQDYESCSLAHHEIGRLIKEKSGDHSA